MKYIFTSILLLSIVHAQGQVPYGYNKDVGKKAKVNGIELYYEIYGEGQPLVMLHGNGGSSGSGANIMSELTANYKVITVDHRCHGQSGCTEELNYRLMASDINELLNQLRIDSAYIYGHSDGGIMGLIMAFSYPDKVKKLVVSGANIKRDSTGLQPEIVSMMKDYPLIEQERMRKQIKLMVEYPNIEYSELHGIKCPVLIISGDRDAVRLSHTVKIFENIEHSQLSVLPGTTHFVFDEHPQLILDLMQLFYEQPFKMPSTIEWAKAVARQIMPGKN